MAAHAGAGSAGTGLAGIGLPDTEAVSVRHEAMDGWSAGTILEALWEGQAAAVASVRPALPALAASVEAAASRLGRGGRLAYAGAGTSGRLGAQDAAELQPTFNWPAERLVVLLAGGRDALLAAVEDAEDDEEAGREAVCRHAIGPNDVLLGLAASGTTPFTLGCVREAGAAGALTVGISNRAAAALLGCCDHPVLLDSGAEAVAGSTRMKAGTAQRAALTIFSTALMVRLGRVWRGRMVDVQARNAKLRRRSLRMLQELTGADEAQAREALDSCGGRVKPAVVSLLRQVPAADAEALLRGCGGRLREAIRS